MSDQDKRLIEDLRAYNAGFHDDGPTIFTAAADRLAELTTLRPMEDAPRIIELLNDLKNPDNGIIISGSPGPLFDVGWGAAWDSVRQIIESAEIPLPAVTPTPSEVQG